VLLARTNGGLKPTVSLPLFVGFTVVSTGGPLALAALYGPGVVSPLSSAGLEVVLAAVLFGVPMAVWYAFSGHVASAGGLYAFVEAGLGRKFALVQGAIWTISYFLYLPYTITYVVYYVLPAVVGGTGQYRPWLEVLLPLALAALGFVRLRSALLIVGALAVLQLAVLLAFATAAMAHLGTAPGAFGAHGPARHILGGTVNFSLLFICVSLPLFLGGEATSGARTVRRGLTWGFVLSVAFVLLGLLAWVHAGPELTGGEVPGLALAQRSWGHPFAVAVGLTVAASVAGLIVAEYLALSRLLHAMSRMALKTTTLWVAAGFVVADLFSLINPDAFYSDLLKPSLVALWVAQLPVFFAFPFFARRHRVSVARSLVLAGASAALMSYGLYTAIVSAVSS
jgi:amino acid transporter